MTDAMSDSAAYGNVVEMYCPSCRMSTRACLCHPDNTTPDPRSGEERRAPAFSVEKKVDMINDPPHYGGKDNPYEVIKVLRAWGYYDNAPRFTSIKYLARAGKKGDIIEDLKKAMYYVQAEIADIEEHRRKKAEEKS